MTVKVYVDVLFIINFIIDYILLSITSLFVKKRPSIVKTCLASALGAVYAAFVFFIPLGTFFIFTLSALTSLFMVIITYGVRNAAFLFKNIAVFYLVSFVTSGVGFAVLFLGNRYGKINFAVNAGVFYADINAYTMLAIFVVSVTVIHLAVGYVKKQRIKAQFLYNVTIEKNGKSVTDTALFDTGNFLRDPISQNSVLVAEWQTVSVFFSDGTLSECVAKHPGEFLYIPCHGINGNAGLFAFRPDKIISDEITLSDSVFVGISETPLDKEGGYRMILPNDSTCINRTERM